MNLEKVQLQLLVNECNSLSEIIRKQGKAVSGASIKILKAKLEAYEIKYYYLPEHNSEKTSLKDKLREGTNIQASKLKSLLIREGLKEDVCECCGQLPYWNGKSLVLQLDHINGNHYDNRIENLRVLCPNCHTQTDTFGNKKKKEPKYCIDCGCEISSRSTRCRKCSALFNKEHQTRKDKPSKDGLLELIKTKSFTEIGKLYNCSDNNVRKWCRQYDLPSTKKEIKMLYF